MQKLDVITVGEAMVLFAAQQPGPLDETTAFTRATAGAELNVATGLARLGLRTGYLSRVGNDSFGRFLVAAMVRDGIDHQHVAVDSEHPTGFMLKSRSTNGSDPQIEYFRRGSAASHMSIRELDPQYLTSSRHVHLTGIYVGVSPSTRKLVLALAAQARAAGQTISFDPNLRPALWPSPEEMISCLNHLASFCDWIFPGLAEGQLLTGRASAEGVADFYLERGAQCVVVKLGEQGAYYASAQGCGYVSAIAVSNVVDTVGAGDGFAVGVISGLLEGLPIAAAVARGNAVGARVVQFPGDCDGLPTHAELLEFQAAAALLAGAIKV